MPLEVGSYVGRIRIDALIGAGGMGEVYRGWDEKLERAVALKSITAERRLSPAMRSRFLREARVLSKLDHPNICRIWDVLELVDGDWLVLELIEGPTLRQRIERGLPRQEAIGIALEVARVLAIAHGRGIIHRDLKPDNVMLTESGTVKVLDFGLARAVEADYAEASIAEAEPLDLDKTLVMGEQTTAPDDSRTLLGSLVGTLHYMSPEQARGLPLTPASDIYSLGVMLHEMLSGNFGAYGEPESTAELLQRVQSAQLVPLDLHDRELRRLLARMTALQPSDRIASGELVTSLERIATRAQRRRRRIVNAVSIAAMVAIVIAGVFVIRQLTLTGSVFASRRGSRIAVLPFRNATGDQNMQWIELGLMDHVARGLTGVRGADVIGSDAVLNAMKHLRIAPGSAITADARKRLLDATGADALLLSTVTLRDGRYTIRYAAFDRERTADDREVTAELITDAANRMSQAVAEQIDPAAQHRATYDTRDTFASIAFDMGRQLELTRGGKYGEPYFQVAADRDPHFLEAKERLADNWAKEGRFADANPMMDEVLREARRRNNRDLLVRSLINRAYWDYGRGDTVSEERYAREALTVAQQLGDPRRIAQAQNALAIPLMAMMRLDEAEKLELASLETARKLHSRIDEAPRVNNLGLLATRRGDRAAAKKWMEEALRIGEEIGYRDLVSAAVGNLATIYGDEGDYARAEQLSNRQVAMARELGDKRTEIEGLANLGLWAYAQREEERAIRLTEEASGAAAQFGALQLQALLESNLAQAYARLGDLTAAERASVAAMGVAEKMHFPEVMPDVLIGAAYPAIRAGRLDEAARLLDRADAIRASQRATVFRARLLYERGRYADASKTIERARTMTTGSTWLPQYESMRVAFAESAKSGKPSTMAFEETVKR